MQERSGCLSCPFLFLFGRMTLIAVAASSEVLMCAVVK